MLAVGHRFSGDNDRELLRHRGFRRTEPGRTRGSLQMDGYQKSLGVRPDVRDAVGEHGSISRAAEQLATVAAELSRLDSGPDARLAGAQIGAVAQERPTGIEIGRGEGDPPRQAVGPG